MVVKRKLSHLRKLPKGGFIVSTEYPFWLPVTEKAYNNVKASGMMWEYFPEFIGNFEEDIPKHLRSEAE